ncbi:U-box domain-containing protein 3 [Dendrobium catenatum]|uniref:U-box domain-containing protein 3 n=1 Tax=Dendrobium catenatum TaxID=906689 RepID=A0A2I0W0D9_9ASPA|nr:U-box domain-containing protein 3 [Dendrobium catenatum]PKU69108.1 U-box domain-containing protein 3 [Dendrobium catenatum]
MCQNPNPSFGPNHNGLPSPSNPKEDRELKRQVQVKEFALVLANSDVAVRVQAARDIRKIVRGSPRGRSAFAVPAIIQPLVAMLQSADHVSRESALLALLNMAVRNERNKEKLVSSGTVPLLVEMLGSDNTLKEMATAAILTLSASKSNKSTIAASGATPLLVNILISGSIQGRVDAVTALYNLSDCHENGTDDLFLSAEAVIPLLTLLKDSKKYSKFAAKTTALLSILSESEEGRCAISEVQGGILTIVETVEEGSLLSTEHAVRILLSLCRSNREKYRELILNEGPIPGLFLLTVEGTKKACNYSHDLLKLLRYDSQSKKSESKEIEAIDYSNKAEETAKMLLQDMVRRNMEENIKKLQLSSAATSSQAHS